MKMAEECGDANCPRHGSLKTRGAVREGKVVSARAKRMAVVEIKYSRAVPKYERMEKRRSKIHAHLPGCFSVKVGDRVRIAECRKISKTKSHVVVEVVK